MTTAIAPTTPPSRPRAPSPRVEAACALMASDWSPWHMILYGLTWDDYQHLLAARAATGRRRLRVTYDRGAAEVMTPGGGEAGDATPGGTAAMTVGNRHERWKKLLARLLETAALGLRVPLVGSGNVTLGRADLDRGLEPDECYYIQNAGRVTTIRELDLTTDPPPDLVIEVEASRTVVDRLDLLSALGVPEVWRYDGDRLRFFARSPAGSYAEVSASLAVPLLTPGLLGSYLARAGTTDDTTLCLELLDWARQAAPPS